MRKANESLPLSAAEAQNIVNRLVAGTAGMELTTFHPGTGLERVIVDPEFWKQSYITWDWGPGVALAGLIDADEFSTDGAAYRTVRKFVRYWIDRGLPPQTVNSTLPYYAMLWLGMRDGEAAMADRARQAAEYCLKDARFCTNGLWNHTGLYFEWSEQVWIDTVYVAGLLLIRAGEAWSNREYGDMIFKQVIGHWDALYSAEAGLLYHGYSVNENHHFSGVFWGRGNAWMALVLAEMLASRSFDGDRRKILLGHWTKLADKLLALQDGAGLWHTVLPDPASPLEASCTAGFAKAFLQGWRSGSLDDRYRDAGFRAIDALRHYVGDAGDLFGTSAGTGVLADPAEYAAVPMHHIQPWGQGLALQAFSEYLRCLKRD